MHDRRPRQGWWWRPIVARVRRWMDGMARVVQGKPSLSRAVARVRAVMRWFVSGALQRYESKRARRVMADARQVMANAPTQPEVGPKVLFVTLRKWALPLAVDVTLAQALRLRGARCEFFSCGGGLPICEVGWPATDATTPCAMCGSYVAGMVDAAQFPRRGLDDVVPDDERRAIGAEVGTVNDGTVNDAAVSFRGRELDPLVEQSLLWSFRTSTLPDTDEIVRARHDFRVGAAIVATAAPRLLDEVEPDVLVVLNGLFYEDRILREEAEARGIRVVTYEIGAQAETLFLSDRGAAPDNDISDLWATDGNRPLSDDAERALDLVLDARRRGTALRHRFYRRPPVLIKRASTPDEDTPMVAVFPNVSWDTAVTGRTLGFDTMLDWIAETVRLAQAHPELQFVIRAHPAASQIPGRESRDRVTDFVRRSFATLPENLQLIDPEVPFDSYALIDAAHVVVVYTSTIGLEAAVAGKPVCVAGNAHYVGLGFTNDITDRDHYRALFDDLSWTEADPHKRDLARRYAYLYLCRAMIPFPAVADQVPRVTFKFTSVDDLAPGHDPNLDLICDGILGDGPIRRS